jgi:hypothetical protein
MRNTSYSGSSLILALASSSLLVTGAFAQTNPEDISLTDEPIAAPVANPAPAAPKVPTSNVASNAGETVTVPRAVWEQLLKDVEDLKKSRVPSATSAEVVPAPEALPTETLPASDTTSSTNRNYLLLPDISFISNSTYLASSDKRNEDRNSLGLEGEIGLQGYVYPNVKYDGYFVASPNEDEAFGVEEGYLTFLGVRKGLNVQVGRKFAPFGRTGELHPHSWSYSRQLLARQALVAPENLVGQGVNFNYTLPTSKKFFTRLSLGAFSGGEEASTRFNAFDTTDPFEGGLPSGTGAGLDRFYNARLWAGTSLSSKDELEFGISHARGRSTIESLVDIDGDGNETLAESVGRVNLTGADISFRRFTGSNSRLLLRGEYFKYKPRNLPTSSAAGYYGLANYKFNKYNDVGLLFENTEFPNAPGQKEKAASLIYTRQFNERYFIRLQGTHGDRPGEKNYNELRLQFVAGLGPHTHELE